MRDFAVREDSVVCGICDGRFNSSEAVIVKIADDKKSVSFVHDVCEKNRSMDNCNVMVGHWTRPPENTGVQRPVVSITA